MSWYVQQFRDTVNNGHFNQERAKDAVVARRAGSAALDGVLRFEKYGGKDARPPRLERSDFASKRLWVARQVGLLVADRVASIAVISTIDEAETLYVQLEFGVGADGEALAYRHRKLHGMVPGQPHNQLQQAVMWAKNPIRNTELHRGLLLPQVMLAAIDAELQAADLKQIS